MPTPGLDGCSSGLCKCGGTICAAGEVCKAGVAGGTPNPPTILYQCSCDGGPACDTTIFQGIPACCPGAGCVVVTENPAHCGGCGRACPSGFDCKDSICICDGDADCGPGGTCVTGKCVCGGTQCAPGKRCVLSGGCG